MSRKPLHIVKFSINNWNHLYSLEQAINRAEEATGKNLGIAGKLRNQDFLDNKDTPVAINFYQVDNTPDYQRSPEGHMILGQMQHTETGLACQLPVDERVFEELKKNLMEYADIDGIHIVVSLGLLLNDKQWPLNETADIVKLDYAMRGDA